MRYGYRCLSPLPTPVVHAVNRSSIGCFEAISLIFFAKEDTRYQVAVSCPPTERKECNAEMTVPIPVVVLFLQLLLFIFRQIYGSPRRCGRSSGHRDRRDRV